MQNLQLSNIHNTWFKTHIIAICSSILVFFFWFNLLSFKYYHFGYYDWDFALYSQTMWNLAHGSLTVSLFGMNFLGNHAHYFSFFLLPIYIFFQHPLTLLAFKSLSFSISAFLIYHVAIQKLNKGISLLFLVIFITFPTNIFALLYEFHFIDLAIPLILFTYIFFQKNKYLPFIIFATLLSLVKENMPSVIICFGIYALFDKNKGKFLWSFIPIVLGFIIFTVSMFIIIPSIRSNMAISSSVYTSQYQNFITGNSPELFLKLQNLSQKLFSIQNQHYLSSLFGPLALTSILSPHILFLSLPLFVQNLLSFANSLHTIFFHYSITITPFIFLSSINTITYLKRKVRDSYLNTTVIIITISCLMASINYHKEIMARVSPWKDSLDPFRWEMVDIIPPKASVISSFDFLAPLSTRKNLYPFYYVFNGKNNFTDKKPYTLPSNLNYALLDMQDPWMLAELNSHPTETQKNIANFFSQNNWHILSSVENIILFKKNYINGPRLVEFSNNPFIRSNNPVDINIENQINLNSFSYDLENEKATPLLHLTFFWKKTKQTQDNTNYSLILTLKENQQIINQRKKKIGYEIYPTNTWPQNNYIKEHFWLRIPKTSSNNLSLELKFINNREQKIVALSQHTSNLILNNSVVFKLQ